MNRLTSVFEVNKSFLIIQYSLIKEGLIEFDLVSYSGEAPIQSGGESHNEQEIPVVKSFKVNGIQNARLQLKE